MARSTAPTSEGSPKRPSAIWAAGTPAAWLMGCSSSRADPTHTTDQASRPAARRMRGGQITKARTA
jgi:hypothetical protein